MESRGGGDDNDDGCLDRESGWHSLPCELVHHVLDAHVALWDVPVALRVCRLWRAVLLARRDLCAIACPPSFREMLGPTAQLAPGEDAPHAVTDAPTAIACRRLVLHFARAVATPRSALQPRLSILADAMASWRSDPRDARGSSGEDRTHDRNDGPIRCCHCVPPIVSWAMAGAGCSPAEAAIAAAASGNVRALACLSRLSPAPGIADPPPSCDRRDPIPAVDPGSEGGPVGPTTPPGPDSLFAACMRRCLGHLVHEGEHVALVGPLRDVVPVGLARPAQGISREDGTSTPKEAVDDWHSECGAPFDVSHDVYDDMDIYESGSRCPERAQCPDGHAWDAATVSKGDDVAGGEDGHHVRTGSDDPAGCKCRICARDRSVFGGERWWRAHSAIRTETACMLVRPVARDGSAGASTAASCRAVVAVTDTRERALWRAMVRAVVRRRAAKRPPGCRCPWPVLDWLLDRACADLTYAHECGAYYGCIAALARTHVRLAPATPDDRADALSWLRSACFLCPPSGAFCPGRAPDPPLPIIARARSRRRRASRHGTMRRGFPRLPTPTSLQQGPRGGSEWGQPPAVLAASHPVLSTSRGDDPSIALTGSTRSVPPSMSSPSSWERWNDPAACTVFGWLAAGAPAGDALVWLLERGYAAGPATCSRAAWTGDVARLRALRQRRVAWDGWTTRAAAARGHVELLAWAADRGCSLGTEALTAAVAGDRLGVLQWHRSRLDAEAGLAALAGADAPAESAWTGAVAMCAAAVGSGATVRWLIDHAATECGLTGAPAFGSALCRIAACYGRAEALVELLAGAEMTGDAARTAMDVALANGHTHVVAWLRDVHGVPWPIDAIERALWACDRTRESACAFHAAARCTRASCAACLERDVAWLEWLIARGCPLAEGSASRMCALLGLPHVLEWLRRHVGGALAVAGDVHLVAAREGHARCLAWFWHHAPGLTWDERVCTVAAQCDHEAPLRWLRYGMSPPCPWNADAHVSAARSSPALVRWLWHHGAPCDERLAESLLDGGHDRTLAWCVEHGCPWGAGATRRLAAAGDTARLAWLAGLRSPAPAAREGPSGLASGSVFGWDATACEAAALNGHFDTLVWLRSHGCPWDARVCVVAVTQRSWRLASWALAHGAPASKELGDMIRACAPRTGQRRRPAHRPTLGHFRSDDISYGSNSDDDDDNDDDDDDDDDSDDDNNKKKRRKV